MTTYYTYDSATQRLSAAPKVVRANGHLYGNPKPEHYALIGAYPRGEGAAPTPPEGKVAVPDGYALVNGEWIQQWRFDDAPPPPPKVYSTSDLIYAIMSRGVYATCRQWIEEQGLRDLVLATKEFTSDMEAFDTIKNGLQQLLGYTYKEVAEDVSNLVWLEHKNMVMERLKKEWKMKRPIFSKTPVFTEKENQ